MQPMVLLYLPTKPGDWSWANFGIHILAPWVAYGDDDDDVDDDDDDIPCRFLTGDLLQQKLEIDVPWLQHETWNLIYHLVNVYKIVNS